MRPGVVILDKKILEQYIDACELITDMEDELAKLKKQKAEILQDVVKGSSPEYPYTEITYHLEGAGPETSHRMDLIRKQEQLLKDQKLETEKIRAKVDAWMLQVPVRMRRIIRMRVFQKMSWRRVADRLGRDATEDSVKKEYQRFMKD